MDPYHKKSNSRVVVGTGLLLLLAFLAVIIVFFIFSALTPFLVGPCVAVVDVNVPLTVEGAPPSLLDPGYPGSGELAYTVESLNERDDIGAVVFVFNSPGGSVVATGELYNAIKNLEKPKVSYFREVAASGAYYAATGTDYIVSDPNAITGSIGVVSTSMELSGLFDQLGINVTTIKSGTNKDIGSPYRNMTSEEETILQNLIDDIYLEFRSVIIDNRGDKLNMAIFDEVTDGRILSGKQAYKAGLVDELGTKDDALMKAAELANISAESPDDVRVCYVSSGYSEGGLFSMEGILHMLQLESNSPSLNYK
ncbi:signal peptide peptidase SppA [Candidatus Micrarchaeota archaeon]|nr:signal peptide peptidase SppA [Candidatus Micrarchaeota archaeon]